MLKRSVTAIVLIALVIMMIYLGASNHIYIDMLIMLFAVVGSYEMYHSFRKAGYINNCIPLIVLCVGIYPLWYFAGLEGLAIIFSLAIVLSLAVFTFKSDMEMKDLMATIFTFIYPFGLVSLAFYISRNYSAVFAVSYAIFLPVFADTFAYLVGSTLKGPKMCPSISPKKTISGGIGGLIGAMLASVIFFLLFDYFGVITAGYQKFSDSLAVTVVVYLFLGLLGGVIAEIGDLAASRIKRTLGIKDFGNIFPGHGGVLDRIDSIMFTLVMLFIAFEIMY